MKLYRTTSQNLLHDEGNYYILKDDWNHLINRSNLYDHLKNEINSSATISESEAKGLLESALLPPIGSQEVWAAGVTYLRSMEARMEEAKESGGADLYDRVYNAQRPELFFKALPQKVVGPKGIVYIRKDSLWNVPEPELTLFINSSGSIEAFTVGNDMSSRSIEGENALYLPQAKVYDRSASLGPCLYVSPAALAGDTLIEMTIVRNGKSMFHDSVAISRIKRPLKELVDYLYRESTFDDGCFLMTGTCLVPPSDFTLAPEDEIYITIEPIGTLMNKVSYRS